MPSGRRSPAESAGLAIIGVSLTAGMIFDAFLPAAAGIAAALLLVMVVGSSFKTLCAALAVQILLTAGQLDSIQAALGLPLLKPDEMLLAWFAFLWLIAAADGRIRRAGIGAVGMLVLAFLSVSAFSAVRGFAAGHPGEGILALTRTNLGYACFFPAMWLLDDERRFTVLWNVLLASSIVAGTFFLIKGLTGTGEGVHYLYASGLRIGSRQANPFAVVLLMLLARLWLSPRRPSLFLALPVAVLLIGCLVLSGTRALWGGCAVAASAAWIVALFRKGGVPGGIGRHVMILTVSAVVVIAAVLSVSTLGIVSTSQLASRIEGGGSYALPIDIGLLSRLISWTTIMDGTGPMTLLLGRGAGAEITYFKPEFGEIWTIFYVDGSFWQVFLNAGLLGVVSLGALYGVSTIQAARLFLRTGDPERCSRALGVFCSLVLLIVASMMASVITNYNYTALWAVLLAILQTERNREKRAREDRQPFA